MPFSDLLKKFGAYLGAPQGAGVGPGGYGTPPFVPQQPSPGGPGIDPGVDPSGGAGGPGLVTPEMQAAARRQGLLSFGASLLANSGPQPGPGIGFGAALGQAIQAGQAGNQGSIDNQLQQLLLKSQIQRNERGPAGNGDPSLVAEYKFAQANGYTGSFQEYIKYKQGQVQEPSAIQEAKYFATLTPEQQRQYLEVKRAQATPFVPAQQGGADVSFDRRTGTSVVAATPEQNQAAAAALKAAEAGGSAAGKIDTERASTFQQDVNLIDDEILRTQRLLTEFQNGKYQTGPIAGRLPNITDSAQNLEREQTRDVLKNISQATFGALSEGERGFLKGLGIDPTKNEGSNIAYLEEKLASLKNAKQRLVSRPPVSQTTQRGGQTTSDVGSLVEKYRTKK